MLFRRWPLLLLGVLLPLLMVIGLTEDVFRGGGFAWDKSILDWWRAHRTPGLTVLARGLAVAGGLGILPLLTLALAWRLWYTARQGQARFLVLSVGGSLLLNVLAKLIFQRPRPDVLGAVMVEPGYSFPSGHAMTNAAFGLAVFLVFRKTSWPLAAGGLVWGLLVGVSRTYLGVHYPTDVLVGTLASVAWVCGLWLLL